jgi:copper transport protein
MGRSILAVLGVVILALLLVGKVEAHANLVRSEPAAGALLQTAPKELVLEFSEELDTSFSRAQLFNSKNQIVNAGPGVVDPSAPRILRLALLDLPKDSYTAIWRSRSAVDGHIAQGSVPFGVGVAVTTTSLIPAPGTPDPALETPPPLDSVTRWLALLLAALAFGGVPFGLLVWRPAYRAVQRKGDYADADATMTQGLRRLILIGGTLFLLANALFLVVQASDAAGVPLTQAIGAPIVQLLGGRSGLFWLVRVGLTLLIGGIAWRLPSPGRGAAWLWWIALALVAATLLTFSFNAHGAAEQQGAGVAVVLDWLHITAMVAWLGGLIPLSIALRAARRTPEGTVPLAVLIPRFSRLAATCVVTLTLTGLYSYTLHINGLDLLAATTYGRALLVKLGLFGLLLLLGGLNLFVLSPRLRTFGNRLAAAFSRSVRTELIAGALLLLAVGAMTSVAPSKTAWEEHERLGIAQEAQEGAVGLTLRVAPAQIGDNEWAVDVTDKRPGAQTAPAKVLLRFDMQGMAMGKLQTETQTANKERYTARGSFTSMGGRWHVEVVLRRAGFDDVTHIFQMDIVHSPTVAAH